MRRMVARGEEHDDDDDFAHMNVRIVNRRPPAARFVSSLPKTLSSCASASRSWEELFDEAEKTADGRAASLGEAAGGQAEARTGGGGSAEGGCMKEGEEGRAQAEANVARLGVPGHADGIGNVVDTPRSRSARSCSPELGFRRGSVRVRGEQSRSDDEEGGSTRSFVFPLTGCVAEVNPCVRGPVDSWELVLTTSDDSFPQVAHVVRRVFRASPYIYIYDYIYI